MWGYIGCESLGTLSSPAGDSATALSVMEFGGTVGHLEADLSEFPTSATTQVPQSSTGQQWRVKPQPPRTVQGLSHLCPHVPCTSRLCLRLLCCLHGDRSSSS